jgi:dihydrofolate reductase
VKTIFMMSLDGYIAGRNVSRENPGGVGADQLHEWMHDLASWRERQGLSGGTHNIDSDIIGEWFDTTGAVIMGRMMYDTGAEFWGDDPPFRAPVFVLTHRPLPSLSLKSGTSFTFVTDGIQSALAQALAAAGDRNVDIAGGADTVQQFLSAGLVDEIQLHIAPAIFGGGLRLFDHLGAYTSGVEPIRVVQGDRVVHLKYRIVR